MTNYLITGGTGTFGHACVRQLLTDPKCQKIIVLSRDEQKQEAMARLFPDERMRFFLGDVRDEGRLHMAMRDADYVIHAAALKIVPKGEYDPIEYLETNANGTANIIRAALGIGVRRMLLLSTDKAVAPVNLYGATKLVAERLILAANNLAGPREPYFSVARYGNVTGSRGSVLELWEQQLAAGEPLTITEPNATRFWISDRDAVAFALRCIQERMQFEGGYIYVPKMPSYKIQDLATAFIQKPDTAFSTYNKVGLRPGEKLHEEIIGRYEQPIEFLRHFEIGGDFIKAGNPKPPEWTYTSDNNPEKLGVEELKVLIEQWMAGRENS